MRHLGTRHETSRPLPPPAQELRLSVLTPALAFLTVLSAAPATSWAQDLAAADALFNKGLADMEAGRFDTACPAIGESYRLDPRGGTLFTLAECEAKAGKIATAVARYEDYLQFFSRLTPQQQKKQLGREKIAAEQKQALSQDVPLLTLILPPTAPQDTHVLRDGVELARPALGIPLPVDPGEHVIVVQVPGQPPSEHRVTLLKKEKKTLQLEVKVVKKVEPPPPGPKVEIPPPPPEPPSNTGPSGRRVGAYVLGGVGVASLVIGGVTGGMVFAKKGTITSNCDGPDCNRTGFDAVNGAKTLGLVSTVTFIAGGASLVTGAVLFFTEPKNPRAKTGTSPRWMSAGVTPGPQGVLAHAGGVW